MAKYSVQYNIYDSDGSVLHDGDIVRKQWGGGNDDGRVYYTVEFHQLTIGKRGKLRISGCENIVDPEELRKINPTEHKLFKQFGLNNRFKVYRS